MEVGWGLNPMTGVLLRRKEGAQTGKKTTEAEPGVLRCKPGNTTRCWEETGKDLSSGPSEAVWPCRMLISPPDL